MVDTKTKQQLKINPAPFKSSHLATPPSPFSPRTPLSLTFQAPQRRADIYPTPDASVLPPPPLHWLWQCHQCRRTYSLGVTRRCLEDGHHFCAGTTTVKTWRKPLNQGRTKKHKACASEFDYQGWKAWGRWRRSGRRDLIYGDSSSSWSPPSSSEDETGTDSESAGESKSKRAKHAGPKKDCWNTCDYPSECRWGKQFGIHTPVAPQFPTLEVVAPAPAAASSPPATTFEGILKPENCKEAKKDRRADKMDFWGALAASATRRRSVPPSSPLAEGVEDAELAGVVKDRDGDVAMETIDPALLEQRPVPPPPPSAPSPSVAAVLAASAPVATLKEIICKGSKRASKRAETKEPARPGPVRTASVPGVGTCEHLAGELAPLERVKSRGSGYQSLADLLLSEHASPPRRFASF